MSNVLKKFKEMQKKNVERQFEEKLLQFSLIVYFTYFIYETLYPNIINFLKA